MHRDSIVLEGGDLGEGAFQERLQLYVSHFLILIQKN